MAGTDATTKEILVCTPFDDIAEYQGTRTALEAEGVIPAGTKCPMATTTFVGKTVNIVTGSAVAAPMEPRGHESCSLMSIGGVCDLTPCMPKALLPAN